MIATTLNSYLGMWFMSQSPCVKDRLIITAASAGYATSLLSLLGSINCDWPNHPDVLVYDLGLPESVVSLLQEHRVDIRKVPAFVPHWRMDYTWKPWCFNDAAARTYLWLDAGLCVLRSMDEVFLAAERLGYFAVSLYNHPCRAFRATAAPGKRRSRGVSCG